MPCGYYLEEAEEEGERLLRTRRSPTRPPRATATSSRSMPRRSSRGPGPRIVDGLEILAWAAHPEAYPEPARGSITRLR